MPRGDGTGPWGHGPMTGRGGGFCRGYGMSGFANPVPGRGGGRGGGRGFGGGGGRGRRNMYRATGRPGWARPGPVDGFEPVYGTEMSKAEEMEALKQQAETFRMNLEDIEKRLETLESDDE